MGHRLFQFILAGFVLFIISRTGIQAQQMPIRCGNDLFMEMVRTNYPEFHRAIGDTFDSAKNAVSVRSDDTLSVRVVVHVIWKEEEENLHDSIILDQIRVLNEDFNRRNADTSDLRAQFSPVAGSPKIRFELDQIIRVQTNQLFNIDILGSNLLAEVKHSADGGSDAIDPDHYLNIWICKIQPLTIFGIEIGQILGFAFPPMGLPHWPEDSNAPTPGEDGVVIDYRVFGSNNPNEVSTPGAGIIQVRGRTPVHEIGHYLGLRHIWGDGGLLGANDCNQSDGIDDTPFASAQSNFDCDKTKNSCTQIEAYYGEDVPDLIENFMDYASEDCMNMFTRGQVEVMRNVLLGPRSGLIEPVASTANPNTLIPFTVSLFPNPAKGPVSLEITSGEATTYTVRIYSSTGVMLWSEDIHDIQPGRVRMQPAYNFETPGMFYISVVSDKGQYTTSLVVF